MTNHTPSESLVNFYSQAYDRQISVAEAQEYQSKLTQFFQILDQIEKRVSFENKGDLINCKKTTRE